MSTKPVVAKQATTTKSSLAKPVSTATKLTKTRDTSSEKKSVRAVFDPLFWCWACPFFEYFFFFFWLLQDPVHRYMCTCGSISLHVWISLLGILTLTTPKRWSAAKWCKFFADLKNWIMTIYYQEKNLEMYLMTNLTFLLKILSIFE